MIIVLLFPILLKLINVREYQIIHVFGIFVYTCYIEFRRLSPKPRPTGQPRIHVPLFCLW